MSSEDSNKKTIINLLTSRIFHDIGNCFSLLNFFVEINRDNPTALDFNELIEINSRMLVNLHVLEYMFLSMTKCSRALTDIEQYLEQKDKKVAFHLDLSAISEERFVLMVHSLLLLSRLVFYHAKIDVFGTETDLEFRVFSSFSLDEERLGIFRCISSTSIEKLKLPDHSKSHVYYIKSLLAELGLEVEITFSVKNCTLRIFPRN